MPRVPDGAGHRGTSFISRPPPQDPTVALCLGIYGHLLGPGDSYERGTPAADPGCREGHVVYRSCSLPPEARSPTPLKPETLHMYSPDIEARSFVQQYSLSGPRPHKVP